MKYTSKEEKKKVGRDYALSWGAVVAAKTFLCSAGMALCCVHLGSLVFAGGGSSTIHLSSLVSYSWDYFRSLRRRQQ